MGNINQEAAATLLIFGLLGVTSMASFIFWVKFELKQIRKDMTLGDDGIESKRAENVKALTQIYDLKIDQSRDYSKGLFESQQGAVKNIADRMKGMEGSLDKIIGLLMKDGR